MKTSQIAALETIRTAAADVATAAQKDLDAAKAAFEATGGFRYFLSTSSPERDVAFTAYQAAGAKANEALAAYRAADDAVFDAGGAGEDIE